MRAVFSCDTSVAVGAATSDGSVVFAKNSDRSANECQPLHHEPRREHLSGDTVRCQYIEIPQVETTWELIGSRPHWLWGFEMGVNEWGVTIGNEAVFSREPYEDAALIGMDLVRLGLERSQSADEAVTVIGELIERYGQGGSCEATHFETYHNSFIVADPAGAWVLETAGHRWFARRVRDRAAISNMYTIEHQWDLTSPGAVEYARENGWGGDEFSLAEAYRDPGVETATAACRLDRARAALGDHQATTVDQMMALLRDHGDGDLPRGEQLLPSICMHNAPNWNGETAASLVAHLRPGRSHELAVTAWVSFGSPCLGVFRPVYPFAVGLPAEVQQGGASYDSDSPWWIFERLQRIVAQAPSLAVEVRGAFAELERAFLDEATAVEAGAAQLLAAGERDRAIRTLRAFVEDTSARAITTAQRLTEALAGPGITATEPAMAAMWLPLNERVGIPPPETAAEPATTFSG